MPQKPKDRSAPFGLPRSEPTAWEAQQLLQMMNDNELASLVGAVRGLLDERDLAQRALVENLKGEVEKLRSEVKSLRGADERAERLLRSFAEQTGAALPLAITGAVDRLHGKLATRVAVLEQRSMPTEESAA